jgi:calcineurin-like phosphoesterase family protein
MSVYFTADLHLGHKGIISHSNRIDPATGSLFSSVEAMDSCIISRYNARVSPSDVCYIVGDVIFSNPDKYLPLLNGTKILILGNHDYAFKRSELNPFFSKICEALEVKVKLNSTKQSIYLHHYACRVWNKHHYGAWHLYGHSHGTLPPSGLSFDCGVDTNQYYPYSLSDVATKMLTLTPPTPLK